MTVFTFTGPVDGKSRYIHGHDGKTVMLEYKLTSARDAIAAVRSATIQIQSLQLVSRVRFCLLLQLVVESSQAELDVLFYPDIGLDTMTYFLPYARLAPVQIMTWGHPVTSATRHMDYFISSKQLEPADGDDEYTETVVRLPHIPISFDRVYPPSDIAEVVRLRHFARHFRHHFLAHVDTLRCIRQHGAPNTSILVLTLRTRLDSSTCMPARNRSSNSTRILTRLSDGSWLPIQTGGW